MVGDFNARVGCCFNPLRDCGRFTVRTSPCDRVLNPRGRMLLSSMKCRDFLLANGVCGRDGYTRFHNSYSNSTVDYMWCAGEGVRGEQGISVQMEIDSSPVDMGMSDHALLKLQFTPQGKLP